MTEAGAAVSRDHLTGCWWTGTEETEENVAKGLGPKGGSRKTDRDGESSHEGESRHEAGRI